MKIVSNIIPMLAACLKWSPFLSISQAFFFFSDSMSYLMVELIAVMFLYFYHI